MIEQSILKWLELGDSIQKIEIYNKKLSLFIFKINYLLSKHVHFSQYFHIFIMFLFFAQIWELNIEGIKVNGDTLLEIIKYLEQIFLFQKIINSGTTLKLILNLTLLIYALILVFMLINMILFSKKKKRTFLIGINSFLNLLFVYYINGPLFQIFLYSFLCSKGRHIYLNVECSMNNFLLLISIIFCIIFIFLLLLFLILSSLYISDIGCINGFNEKSKINSSYITLIVIIQIIYFAFEFIICFYFPKNFILNIIYYLLIFLVNIYIRIYSYNNAYYYNQKINYFHQYGWSYTVWFSFCVLIKVLLKLKDITLFVIFGIVLITFWYYFHSINSEFNILTQLKIFEISNLRDIEIYNEILLRLLKDNSHKNKTLIAGIIKRFEEYIKNNPELVEQYNKLINDKHLLKKFNSLKELKILSIISIIYSYNIEKSKDIIDITLHMCYFLINNFKNPLYAIWLCTKVKAKTHVQSYYKYVLMEEIKKYLLNNLTKNKNKLAIKHIQISSVILYNQFVELFKIKIYDAACSQIEYFDILKNNITIAKTTENFLNIGEDILSLRKDIMSLWDKIITLNPFSNESEKDYMVYLDTILQDDVLKRSEAKRFNSVRAEKLSEKNNLYYSLFNQESSAVLLSDGYSHSGKILYATPNFPSLFMFTGKEILNTSIDDLLPDVVQNFHKFLIEDAIKYSNISYIFNDKRDVLLKGKNGGIFNINLYVKPVPDLTFGLIYFMYIEKIQQQNFIFVLDEFLTINGFTETAQVGSNFTIDNNYGLTHFINGCHIGMIIPEIIFQISFTEESNSFNLLKNNIDLKGYLYPIHTTNNLDTKFEKVIEAIKEKKSSIDNKFGAFEEYDDYIKELNRQNLKPYSIFFRIDTHFFVGEKYKYYRIYVINDLLSDNENPLILPSVGNTASADEYNNLRETVLYQSKVKNVNDDSSIYDSANKTLIKKGSSIKSVIKLKTKLNKKSKILIKKEMDELNKDINNKEIILKDEEAINKENVKQINSNSNRNQKDIVQPNNSDSNLNQASIESAEFNKLKNEIINKNDSFYVKLMKTIVIIFIILIFSLICLDFMYTARTINAIIEYLQENLYFIHSKICSACVYNAALNLKLIKEKIINNRSCPNLNCTAFYADLLKECYTELRVQKYNLSYFFPDYLNIFEQRLNAELSIFRSNNTDHLNLDIDMFLNLIIASGLKIIANLTNYFDDNPDNEIKVEILNVYFQNLLKGSIKFFYSDYNGFFGEEKEMKCFNAVSNSSSILIISLTLFVITSLILFFLIFKKSGMEIYFLEKLINFTSSNFDEYLKNLEDLKTKFRSDSNDEEDKNNDELEIGIDEMEGDGKNENNSKNNENDINIKKKVENKESPNKKKNKQNKLQQQRLKKKKIMSDYFIKYNIYFGLKITFLFLLSTSFFIATMGAMEIMKRNYKKFDSTVESINLVYYKSFQTFMIFKEQIEILHRKKDNSKLRIPSDDDIEKPKIGNSLMYFIRSSKYSKKNLGTMTKLYSNDACEVLSKNASEYGFCGKIFSSILTKGLEQSIVQLGLILTSCIEELNSLNANRTLKDIYSVNNTFPSYEIFMGYYMIESFLLTQNMFESFRNDEKRYIFVVVNLILGIYVVLLVILISLFVYFIYLYKKVENSFLNFIGILPAKFIADDESFYKAIFKFGQYFY